jgi:hypothetical protein
MQQWIGCDAHKKFSVFVAVDERGNQLKTTSLWEKTISVGLLRWLAMLHSPDCSMSLATKPVHPV